MVNQKYTVQVHDEYVMAGNTAVLKCQVSKTLDLKRLFFIISEKTAVIGCNKCQNQRTNLVEINFF